ncbi:MAG: C45 family autoproteolytic acyltransferase/hydrolase [Thermomicrobiales bacterium]
MYRRDTVAPLGRGKVLYLTGTPYEQGMQLGQGAADLIHENVRRAARLRDEVAVGRDQADYHAITRQNAAWVERVYPELLEELTGIAEGADVNYEELLSLNLNGHIAYVYSTMLACTQVLATGPATVDGKTYIGKTRDLARGPLLQVFLHREYPDGSYLNEIQTAGRMTIPDGINQYGVSLTCSGQWSPRVTVDLARADSAWLTLNLQPILRQARTATEAIQMIEEQPRASGMQVLVADGTRAVALEVTDQVVRAFDAEEGIVIRTNHYFAPDLQHLVPTYEENQSSYDRYARVREIVTEHYGHISMHDILAILSDHSLPPTDSICRHGDGDRRSKTCAATINCPEDRTMWATLGNPCEAIQAIGRPGD